MKSSETYMVTYGETSKVWYKDGLTHNADGHAMEYYDGHKEWWINGVRHRTDGPAVIYPDGTQCWWIRGEDRTDEVRAWIKKYDIDINTADGRIRFKLTFA